MSHRAGLIRDRIVVAAVLLGAVVVVAYVHHTMSQVRRMLPLELLEQQRDISAIHSGLGELVHVLEHERGRGPDADAEVAREALQKTLTLLGSVRRDFTFDSLTGVSAAHALVNPAVQDMERWLHEGLPGYAPESAVVLELSRARAREAYEAVGELEGETEGLALSMLSAEAQRLNQVRFSLVGLVLVFAIMAAGVVVLYVRQRSARERVAITQARLTDSLESVGQAVALFDSDDRLLMCNKEYRELFHVRPEHDAGTVTLTGLVDAALDARRILSIDDEVTDLGALYRERRRSPGGRIEMQWNDGRFFQVYEQTTNEQGTVCMLTDITDLKVAQRSLEYLATHDALTGLPSRRRFHADLTHILHRARRDAVQVAVIFVDVDRLKWINDTYGHVAGDRFLKEFGLRLGSGLREGDRVARLGGDEFALALADLGDPLDATASAERLLATLAEPVLVDEGTQIRTTVSMGIAMYPVDGEDASTLMKRADDACYHAKSNGRANFQVFNERISARTARRSSIEHHLRAALQSCSLDLVYQPQVALADGRVMGMEALLRWRHPELGIVDPSEFVPVAEDSGLGRLLLAHAVNEVCRQLRVWLDEGVQPCRVWINVSPRQLVDVSATVSDAVARHRLGAEMLGVEITERTFVDDPLRAGRALVDIRSQGLSVAIDDFGVGYSSLGALKDYPLDELKIDASFVRDIGNQGQDMEIVRAIVALARSLGLTVVAEGVETGEQMQVLRARGVDTVQGNIVSVALSGVDAGRYLVAAEPALRDQPA